MRHFVGNSNAASAIEREIRIEGAARLCRQVNSYRSVEMIISWRDGGLPVLAFIASYEARRAGK